MYTSKNIKYLREKKNLTGQQLADRLDVSRSTITSYESGRMAPSHAVLQKICEVLDVSAQDIMFLDIEEQDKEEKALFKEYKTEDIQAKYGNNLYDIRNLVKKVQELEESITNIKKSLT